MEIEVFGYILFGFTLVGFMAVKHFMFK